MYQHARKNRTTVILDPAPEELTDRRIQMVYDYWRSLADVAGLPARRDFDPQALRGALSHTMLVNVMPDGGLIYRVIGTAIVDKMGRDCTGKSVPECYFSDDWDDVAATYRRVIRTRQPTLFTNRFQARGDRQHYHYQRLLCPMTQDGSSVDLVLGAMSFDRISGAKAASVVQADLGPATHYLDGRINSTGN